MPLIPRKETRKKVSSKFLAEHYKIHEATMRRHIGNGVRYDLAYLVLEKDSKVLSDEQKRHYVLSRNISEYHKRKIWTDYVERRGA